MPALLMVALLSDRQRYREPVLFRRQRAGGIRSVCAGGIFQAVEIEPQLARFVEPLVRESRIQKPAGSIGLGSAGRIPQDEIQLCRRWILENWIQLVGLAMQCKFRATGDLRRIAGADQRGDGEGLVR